MTLLRHSPDRGSAACPECDMAQARHVLTCRVRVWRPASCCKRVAACSRVVTMTHLPARTTALVGALLLLAACSGTPEPSASPPDGGATSGSQMFQWTWDSIADRVHRHTSARPATRWVLTSPPQEHILGDAVVDRLPAGELPRGVAAGHARAVRGDGADVPRRRRRRLGRRGGQPHDRPGRARHGVGGLVVQRTTTTPGLYTDADFHHCGLTAERRHRRLPERRAGADVRARQPRRPGHRDRARAGDDRRLPAGPALARRRRLPDRRGQAHGRRRTSRRSWPSCPRAPGIAQEVIRGTGEPVTPEQYLDNGKVYEFAWGKDLQGVLAGSPGLRARAGHDVELRAVRRRRDLRRQPRHRAQRLDAQLRRRRRSTRWPTCSCSPAPTAPRPSTSGYAFSDRDAGPPQDADGRVLDAACGDAPGPDATCGRRLGLPAPVARDRRHGRLAQRRRRRPAGRRLVRGRRGRARPRRARASSWSTPATTSCAPTLDDEPAGRRLLRRAVRRQRTARRRRSRTGRSRSSPVPPRPAQAWDVAARP